MQIRKEEFLKEFGFEMSQDDIELANLRFKLIDTDKSGFIDWDEYVNYECMRRLASVPDVKKLNKTRRTRRKNNLF